VPLPPSVVSLRVANSLGEEIGTIDATLGADVLALAQSFVQRHGAHPELRTEVERNGVARLRAALEAMVASGAQPGGDEAAAAGGVAAAGAAPGGRAAAAGAAPGGGTAPTR